MNDLWLSTPHARALSAFGNVDAIIVRASWAHFKSGEDILSVRRLIETNYPSKVVKSLFVAETPPVYTTNLSKELLLAVRNSIPFSDSAEDGNLPGTITFTDKNITIATTTKGSEFEEVVEQKCDMPEGEPTAAVSLDLKALVRSLRFVKEGTMAVAEGKRKRLLILGDAIEAAVSVD